MLSSAPVPVVTCPKPEPGNPFGGSATRRGFLRTRQPAGNLQGMKLTVLGCSGSVPGPDSAASSYLVTAEGFHLVLDLGSGALGSLQRHIAVPQIGAIGLSHLHPDHCMDLTGLYVAAKYAP